ncbi:MAG: tetratricopeptide repeat protein [Chthoniobacterales bacterium]
MHHASIGTANLESGTAAAEELPEYTAWEAKDHIGEEAIISGRVLWVDDYRTLYVFLFGAHSESGPPSFRVGLKEDEAAAKFPAGKLINQIVSISGTVVDAGGPRINVASRVQIMTERKYNLDALDAALTRASRALAADPGNASAYYGRATVENKKAETKPSDELYLAAIKDYRRSMELDRSKTGALIRVGDCCAALQDYEAAQRAYDQAIDASPEAKKLLEDSLAKEKTRLCYAAIDDLQKLTAFEPKNATLYYRQATLYLMDQDSEDANANFRIAAELEPTNQKYADAARHPVAPFKRQMTVDEMLDAFTKGAVAVGTIAVGAAVMHDAQVAGDAKTQREGVNKIIAESEGRKMECPKCHGKGQFVDWGLINRADNPNSYSYLPGSSYQNFEESRYNQISRKCDRCNGNGWIYK